MRDTCTDRQPERWKITYRGVTLYLDHNNKTTPDTLFKTWCKHSVKARNGKSRSRLVDTENFGILY